MAAWWRCFDKFSMTFFLLVAHSSFLILHSSFFILHSSFFILHSSFFIKQSVIAH